MNSETVMNLLKRLEQRKKLFEQVVELRSFQESSDSSGLYIVENEIAILCDSGVPGVSDNFKCDKTNDSSVKFNCNKSDGFSCGNTNHIFDCNAFTCGSKEGDPNTFSCDALVDYGCSRTFSCEKKNECATPGHVFNCPYQFACFTSNTCSAGGSDWNCDGVPVIDRYQLQGTGEDSVPGDFMCCLNAPGTPQKQDQFDCVAEFKCTASSDFSCVATGYFNCGSDFLCNSAGDQNSTNYHCREKFNCTSSVKCDGTKTDDYNCTAQYTKCNDQRKDCYHDYTCPQSPVDCQDSKFGCHDSVGCPSGYGGA